MTFEDLLEECGGLGKFQFMLIFGISLTKMTAGWSMLQMSYIGFIPNWYCVVEPDNGTHFYNNLTLKKCSMNNSLTGFQEENCQSHFFETSPKTVVSEWNLVCDQKWIKSAITSIQMVGVLVGAVLSGQLSDWIGRRKTFFGYGLYHCLVNFGAAFSTSWEMFAAFRFLIGAGIGGILVVTYPYSLEFVTLKWRPLVAIIPVFRCGIALFALAAQLLQDWVYLHIALGVICIPTTLCYFYIPESVRWLAIKGRKKEAEAVVCRIATMNGKTPPKIMNEVLEKICLQEKESRASGKKYSYKDLFGTWKQAKISIIFVYAWLVLAMDFYGIAFGVTALSGNLPLNIFLIAIVEVPAIFSTLYFHNKIGRKWTSMGMLSIATVSSAGCVIVQFVVPSDSRKNWIAGFSFAAKMGLGASWNAIHVWTSECYPTVIRSLGFGLVNSVARVGSTLAPFVIDLDNDPVMAYIIITTTMILTMVLSVFVPETKGQSLADSLDVPSHAKNENVELAVMEKNGDYKTTHEDAESKTDDSNSNSGGANSSHL